jgi:hypothetical protein
MKAFLHSLSVTFLLCLGPCLMLSAQHLSPELFERFSKRSHEIEEKELAQPFKGISTSEGIIRGLFHVQSTGVSTDPVRLAAEEFLASLDQDQQARTKFGIDDDEWRKWMNQHFYIRQGVGFNEMSQSQRDAAFNLLDASLSAKGLTLTRNIMRLNHTLGELNDDNFMEYGEWLYWITIMGDPSKEEPWGWQLDGHHVIINYFVLGDQVVMTPCFVGSEPVMAESGKYKGTSILQDEQAQGLAVIRSLNESQKEQAILELNKDGNNNLTEAFKDNVVLDYAGVAVSSFNNSQKEQLLRLVNLFVNNLKEGHAKIRMDEIEQYLDQTYFAWIGGTQDQSVFYYRVQSPVILIEFDHQNPIGMRHLLPKGPNRQHIHAVVRTPNGNDYGKDLLRQHYEMHPHR